MKGFHFPWAQEAKLSDESGYRREVSETGGGVKLPHGLRTYRILPHGLRTYRMTLRQDLEI